MRKMKSMSSILLSLYLLLKIPSLTASPTYLISDCTGTDNLNKVLNSLSTHVAKNHSGFFVTTYGNGTKDAVYASYLCRGDQNASSCADCVMTAANAQITVCPNSKDTLIWYDQCMIRYSNEYLFGKMEVDPNEEFINIKSYTGNITLFKDVMLKTMNDLVAPTANNQSGIKFTTKMVNFTKSDTLYAMEQCSPDLSTADCTRCLIKAISRLQIKKGARTLQPSCQIRYETYPFYTGAVNYSSSIPPVLIIPPEIPSSARGKRHLVLVPLSIAVPIVCVGICSLIGFWIWRKKKAATKTSSSGEMDEILIVESLQFDWNKIKGATSNFCKDRKLGKGGFGEVYKGILEDGQEIAVKRLSKTSGQGIVEFHTEIVVVAKLQHKNLVKLLGFCLAPREKILVYEYLPNLSLDRFISDMGKRVSMVWETRFKIICGVARGLLYLHEDSRLKIIHRDLKPSNILLDEGMNPKIADFGLARLFEVDQTHGDTVRIAGTYGYMAPEYAVTGHFSVKSDVYSFGVIVLEIVSGQRNRFYGRSQLQEALLHRAWRLWNEGLPLSLIDTTLSSNYPEEEVLKCIQIGLLCIQDSATERPRMESVVATLSDQSISLPLPKAPTFFGDPITTNNDNRAYHQAQTFGTDRPYIHTGTKGTTDLSPR